jgi:WXXGXW repeat (2 copies)
MPWRDKLAVFLPAVALAALLANPLPAEAHKVIIYDDVYEAPSPPPVDQVEVIPAKPTETVVWKAGYWKVKDGGWVWEAGHYVEKPNVAAVWIPGHWVNHSWGSTWVEGHWE